MMIGVLGRQLYHLMGLTFLGMDLISMDPQNCDEAGNA